MAEHGGDIYTYENYTDFSVSTNPLGLPPKVGQVLQRMAKAAERYPDVQCRRLKKAVSEAERVTEEALIFGNGAADLIFSLVYGWKPKKGLLLAPSFLEYEKALEAVGAEITIHYLREEDNFIPNIEELEKVIAGTDIFFLCNPNNPTGVLLTEKELRQLGECCRKEECLLVVDECFIDLLPEEKGYSMKELTKENPWIFVLKAFTKTYAMAGLRLGYGITSNQELLRSMERARQAWSVSGPALETGIAALEETDYLERSRAFIGQEKTRLEAVLTRMGMQVYPTKGNYIFFQGEETLFEDLLESKVLIRDLRNMKGLRPGFYRIGVRSAEDNEKLVRVLEKRKKKQEEQLWQSQL